MLWPTVLANRQLIAEAEAQEALDTPAVVARLLKLAGDERRVWFAIELMQARRKAAGKLAAADRIIADTEGVEQSTGATIAALKAARFADAGADHVVDACAGVGGDAMALGRVGEVTLVDRDPDRVWASRHNTRLVGGAVHAAVAADAGDLQLHGRWLHIDPSRREAGRRFHQYDQLIPGPAVVERLVGQTLGAAVKLSPGVDPDPLPPGELQFISEDRKLRQAVLWTGRLAQAPRSAVALPSGATLQGAPDVPPCGEPDRYLLAVDPAVERAELMAALADRLDAVALHPKLGLLTRPTAASDPFVTCFERMASMGYHERRLRAWLRDHDAGIVEVKTRGGAIEPNRLANRLRGKGATLYTVFVLREGKRKVAHVTRRRDTARGAADDPSSDSRSAPTGPGVARPAPPT